MGISSVRRRLALLIALTVFGSVLATTPLRAQVADDITCVGERAGDTVTLSFDGTVGTSVQLLRDGRWLRTVTDQTEATDAAPVGTSYTLRVRDQGISFDRTCQVAEEGEADDGRPTCTIVDGDPPRLEFAGDLGDAVQLRRFGGWISTVTTLDEFEITAGETDGYLIRVRGGRFAGDVQCSTDPPPPEADPTVCSAVRVGSEVTLTFDGALSDSVVLRRDGRFLASVAGETSFIDTSTSGTVYLLRVNMPGGTRTDYPCTVEIETAPADGGAPVCLFDAEQTELTFSGDLGDSVQLRLDGRWVATVTGQPSFPADGAEGYIIRVRGGTSPGDVECVSSGLDPVDPNPVDLVLLGTAVVGTTEFVELEFVTDAAEFSSFSITGEIADFVSLEEDSIRPEGSEAFSIGTEITIPADATAGARRGELQITDTAGLVLFSLPLGLDIVEPSATVIPNSLSDPSADRLLPAIPGTFVAAGEIIVGLELDTVDPDAAAIALARDTGGVFRGVEPRSLLYQLEYEVDTVGELFELADALEARTEVEFASLNVIAEEPLAQTPEPPTNDPLWDSWDVANPGGNNWGLEFIDAPGAWDITTGSSDIKIAVIDADLDEDHSDLNDNIAVHEGRGSSSANGHGTHVAGTACAEGNNNNGVTGVAWTCELQLYGYGSGTAAAVVDMLDAVDSEADIVNMSLQFIQNNMRRATVTSLTRDLIEDANNVLGRALIYAELVDRDVLWVFAAGNEERDAQFASPASLVQRFPANVITVAAIDEGGTLSSFSNRGDLVTVAAPGRGIFSTLPRDGCFLGAFCDDNYGLRNGTSMAAPHVSGLASLVMAANPDFSASDVKGCIVASAVNDGEFVPGQPFSVINAPAAIECQTEVELPPQVDIVIGMDLTASMGAVLAQARAEAEEMIQALEVASPLTDFQFAVVSYEDYSGFVDSSVCAASSYANTYGGADDEPFRIDEILTSTPGTIEAALNGLTLGFGSDGPEAYTRALWEIGQSDTGATLGFRPDSLKLLVNFGDNIPHDPNLNEGIDTPTLANPDTGIDPGRNGVIDCGPDDIDLQDDALPALVDAGVRLLHVDSSSEGQFEPYWRQWAAETGGAYTAIGGGDDRSLSEVVIELLQLIPDP